MHPGTTLTDKAVRQWPTPAASQAGYSATPESWEARKLLLDARLGNSLGMPLGIAAKLWATPKASPSGPDFARESRESSGADDLTTQVAKTWPTPQARYAEGPFPGHQRGSDLPTEARNWATPRASANENRMTRPAPSHGNGHGHVLAAQAAVWPTPTSADSHGHDGPGRTLPRVAFGPRDLTTPPDGQPSPPRAVLFPPFVEWLMGWPTGWTDCTQSATASFRSWRLTHSWLLRTARASTSTPSPATPPLERDGGRLF